MQVSCKFIKINFSNACCVVNINPVLIHVFKKVFFHKFVFSLTINDYDRKMRKLEESLIKAELEYKSKVL